VDGYPNSLRNNPSSFNVAKWHKLQPHLNPYLARYDFLIWVDATVRLSTSRLAAPFTQLLVEASGLGQRMRAI
jgi:hypothetical protein